MYDAYTKWITMAAHETETWQNDAYLSGPHWRVSKLTEQAIEILPQDCARILRDKWLKDAVERRKDVPRERIEAYYDMRDGATMALQSRNSPSWNWKQVCWDAISALRDVAKVIRCGK